MYSVSYEMFVTEVGKSSTGYNVKAEREDCGYNQNVIRFQIPKEQVRQFQLGEIVVVTVRTSELTAE